MFIKLWILLFFINPNIINKTLKVNQNNQIALFFEAKRFASKNKIKESIDLFEDLLKIDSNNLRVLNELALLHDTNYKSEFYYNKMIEIDTTLKFNDKELSEKKSNFEIVYTTIVKLSDEIETKKDLEKIILCDVQNEIFPNLKKTFLNLLHDSGYTEVKLEKKIDFEKLYSDKLS